jgi:hypothetical protein
MLGAGAARLSLERAMGAACTSESDFCKERIKTKQHRLAMPTIYFALPDCPHERWQRKTAPWEGRWLTVQALHDGVAAAVTTAN